jgi:hypothetical protein
VHNPPQLTAPRRRDIHHGAMTRRSHPDSLVPLRTDTLIEERVRETIGRALRRQMWLLFLDCDQIQLPLLIPIDKLPSRPDLTGTTQVVANIAELMVEIGASDLVVVWERVGPPTVSAQDADWARSIARACSAIGLPLRAMLLSHHRGVRWFAADDYVGAAPV